MSSPPPPASSSTSAVFRSPRFIKIKRKASESSPAAGFKRFKFVGSSESGDEEALKQLISEKKPSLAQFDDDLLITDYEDFVFEQNSGQLPNSSEGKSRCALQVLQ